MNICISKNELSYTIVTNNPQILMAKNNKGVFLQVGGGSVAIHTHSET